MLTIAIALLISVLVGTALTLFAGLAIVYSVLIGTVLFAGIYFLAFRHFSKKINALMEVVQRDMMANRVEKAIKTLESALPIGKWQLYMTGQIHSQIGTIYYLKRDFPKAFEELKQGFSRHWVGMGMLGICYMHKNKTKLMIETFNSAVLVNKKEPVLWDLYAYCLEKVGEHEKAIAILEKGIKKLGGHDNLEANLEALKSGNKMKMKAYGDLWLQFHLEKPGTLIKQQTKAMTGRRRTIVRR